jgi:hypothetical protein
MKMALVIPSQTITLNPKFVWAVRSGAWCYIVFSLLSIAFPFIVTPPVITPEQKFYLHIVYEASVFTALIFAFMSWTNFHISRRIPFQAVTIDNEGLWPAHRSKDESLVRWDQIADVKERHYRQRLDLIGHDGKVLFKLRYELDDFESLRALAMETVFTQRSAIRRSITYSRGWLHHAAVGVIVATYALLAMLLSGDHPVTALIATPFLCWFIFYDYLTCAHKLIIRKDGIDIVFPTLTRSYAWNRVETVYMVDHFLKGYRHPEVGIMIKGCDKPFRIRRLGVDAEDIAINILKAMKPDETGPVMFDTAES